MKKQILLIAKTLTVIFTLLFGILLTAGTILMENSAAVSSFLGAKTQEIVEDPDKDPNEDTQYYKSVFKSVAEVKANGDALCEEVVAEGTVLLKNENDALPLSKGDTVSLFSSSSVDLVYSGAGSSGTNTSSAVTLKAALESSDVGLKINDTLWNWYVANKGTYGRTSNTSVGVTYTIKDAPWSALPDAKTDSAKAAIFILSRKGSEGVDLAVNTSLNGGDASDMTNGDYLDLSPTEISVLQGLKEQKDAGKFDKIIVIMNSANQVQTDFVDDQAYGIDAFLWCGTLGTSGANAVADILVGNVNPSGRLSDTFWQRHRFNPVYANYGAFPYTSGSTYPYVVYQEGIYNGYRYTETRYEDKVTGRANTGDFDYYEAVSYPFGYGLSYTSFAYSDFKVTAPSAGSDIYTVSVKVTNTGSVSGKETVQVYLQKPYTQYDIENNIEKAAVELVGFDKTEILAPNASETVEIQVEGKYFASYDSYNAKTYIVDAGVYYFTAGKDAHDATNNILAAKGKTTADGMTEEGNAALVAQREVKNFDDTAYSVSTKAKESNIAADPVKITNQFDNADINLYAGADGQKVTYVTRNNWAGTVKFGLDENNRSLGKQEKLYATEQINKDLAETEYTPQPDDVEYPTYASTKTSYSLIDLRAYSDGDNDVTNDVPIEYNNPMWDDFLDQLTWKDMTSLLSTGFRMTYGIASINKPITIDHNGSVGVVQMFGADAAINRGLAVKTNDPDMNSYPTLYPCNGLVAATFNRELVTKYGEQWGEDGLWAGYSGLYGPGCNTHRSAYGGRSYEYYSEDSFLGGKICAYVVSGMKEKGVYAYLKHAILNDQELSRGTICTYANEQTIREIYLRQFQIAIEDGGAQNVMTGYNKIGAVWTGHQGFCNTVLRNEFGMTGFAVTDYIAGSQYKRMPGAILQGNDLPDQDYSSNKPYDAYASGYGEFAWAMRESVHRILFTVVHSNAMNGMSAGTKVIVLTPTWIKVFNGVKVASGALFGASVIFLGVTLVLNRKTEE